MRNGASPSRIFSALALEKKIKYAFVASVVLLVSGAVRAEMGCPPGLFPNTFGAPGGGCIPYNENVPQAPQVPQVRWANRWGALAVATTNSGAGGSVLGVSQGMKSEGKAEKKALSHCRDQGGLDCKLDLTYRNQCAVVVWGGKVTFRREHQPLRKMMGMRGCMADGDANCVLYYSACSRAERTQ